MYLCYWGYLYLYFVSFSHEYVLFLCIWELEFICRFFTNLTVFCVLHKLWFLKICISWLLPLYIKVWLLSDCFSSLLVCVFKFYKVDSDVSGCMFLYYSCLRFTLFSHVVSFFPWGDINKCLTLIRPPNKPKYHSAIVQLGEPMSPWVSLQSMGEGYLQKCRCPQGTHTQKASAQYGWCLPLAAYMECPLQLTLHSLYAVAPLGIMRPWAVRTELQYNWSRGQLET